MRINKNKEAEKLPYFVGVPRFELGTSCSQSRRTNRAVLHPEDAVPFGYAIAKVMHFRQIRNKRPKNYENFALRY